MNTRMPRDRIVYAGLAAFWGLVVVWQAFEHRRLRATEQQLLLNHATDIATSMEVVLRSQRRFGFIPRDRVEAALEALIGASELQSLALVNRHGETITATGMALPPQTGTLPPGTQLWNRDTLTVVELIQIVPLLPRDSDTDKRPVVIMDRPTPPPDERESGRKEGHRRRYLPPPNDDSLEPPADAQPEHIGGAQEGEQTDLSSQLTDKQNERPENQTDPLVQLTDEQRRRLKDWHREHGKRGRRPGHPPWMTEVDYNDLVDRAGLQRFILVLSSSEVTAKIRRDLFTRSCLIVIGLLAAGALGFGWRTLRRAADLRLRLVRAQEMNTHLREMNTAAAGLAHETRNPLNSVRGVAQLIANDPEIGAENRQRAETMLAEVDRVNSRLGEFLFYSRPKPPNPEPVEVARLVDDVARTLDVDRDERSIALDVQIPDIRILADQGQLRQVLFNLLLNAYQATPDGGRVTVTVADRHGETSLRVVDNGPGVPVDAREDIFRPYFTLSEEGTGLGLAVARQIALAHQWDIQYRDADDGGAEFEIRGLRTA